MKFPDGPLDMTDTFPTEILLDVFGRLACHPDALYNAIRVCKDWEDAGTAITWHTVNSELLDGIPLERRQHYAVKIFDLSCPADKQMLVRTGGLSFPRLNSLQITLQQINNERAQPSEIRGVQPIQAMENLLDLMPARMPRLRHVVLHGQPDDWKMVQEFFMKIDNLQSVEISNPVGMSTTIADSLVGHFSQRPSFFSLKGPIPVTENAVQRASQSYATYFSQLRELEMVASAATVSIFSKIAQDLRSLRVNLEGPLEEVFKSVSALHNLEHLVLCIQTSLSNGIPTFTKDDFKHLQTMHKLRHLEVVVRNRRVPLPRAHSLKDEDFGLLFYNLRSLKYFYMECDNRLTSKTLDYINELCPHLTACWYGPDSVKGWII
ncbi:hypothetical protein K470DRAFT_289540 [Piedraia hortae CBS 480.64]|uniref:Uncharacterized protein n=1 Tax=Piedraia hortae CBS 480.64 TaxID=1314780 RepID=A0A6A7BUG7_9PEZI|nr:hypothetical protein K470DRAFT_289540 [Piedraia hortae CBS 480.64]